VHCVSQAEDVEAWDGLPASLQMEVASPQAWLCEAPRRLVVSQRMSGAPKIWTLPRAKLDPLARGLKVTTHALGRRRKKRVYIGRGTWRSWRSSLSLNVCGICQSGIMLQR